MRNQFSVDQIELVELLKQSEVGDLQLPNFQRGYNWKTTSVLKLLDSIHKGHPAGALLFLETSDPVIIAYEGLRSLDEDSKLNFPKRLILDGQQRLTSCHTVFYNKGRNSYYIDLWQLYYHYDEDYENIELLEKKIIVAKKHSEQPDEFLFSSDLLAFSFLQDKKDFRARIYSYKENLRNQEDGDKEFLKFIEQNLDNFVEPFFEYEFPVIILPNTLTIEGICKVFQSINTTGLKLTAYDICVATFMPDNINLKELIDDVLLEFDNLEAVLEGDKTIVLQIIALLSGVSAKKNNLPKNLKPIHIQDEWINAVEGLNAAIDVFDKIGVGLSTSTTLMPYHPMIPVVAATLHKKDYINQSVAVQGQMLKKIAVWFYKSAIEMRYTEGTDNKMYLDYTMLREWLGSDETPKEINRTIHWNPDQIANANKNGAFGKAILTMLNNSDGKDFYTQARVGVKAGLAVKSQLHHIFPKGEFKDIPNINSVFNFTFLTAESNRFIKDDKPSVYVTELATELDLSDKELQARFDPHFIEKNALKELRKNNYDAFIQNRISNYADYLNNEIGLSIQISSDDIDEKTFDNDDNFVQE